MASVDHYEHPCRLADTNDVSAICNVIGLGSSQINNCRPLPEPRRGGAGRVKAFGPDEKRSFVQRPNQPSTRTVEQGRHLAPKPPKPPEEWPYNHKESVQSPSREEIKKKAGWAWWRTALLLQYAAATYNVKKSAKEAQVMSQEGFKDKEEARRSLEAKAQRALSHAVKLNPRLVVEAYHNDTNFPRAWCDRFSQTDIDYYNEINLNHHLATRFRIAKVYEEISWDYVQEALRLYMEEVQTEELKADATKQPKNIFAYIAEASIKSGSLCELWSKAAEWSVMKASKYNTWHFRSWWLRAAMARGHAEWLNKEHLPRFNTMLKSGKLPTEAWRLLEPPGIGHYDNDCTTHSILTMMATDEELSRRGRLGLYPHFADDEYNTAYNTTIHGLKELAAQKGERSFSFLYGCPDFVFAKRAKEGWEREKLGLRPHHVEDFAIGIGFHEYYCRSGLSDQLTSRASPYEQTLAVCADDIVLARMRAIYSEHNTARSHIAKEIVESITSALEVLYERRLHMTLRDSQAADFDRAVYDLLEQKMAKINFKATNAVENARTILYIQEELKYSLLPWFKVSFMFKAKVEEPFICLLSQSTKRINDFKRDTVPKTFDECWSVTDALRMTFVSSICQVGETILNSMFHDPHALDNMSNTFMRFATVFREHLESGNATHKMPRVTSGLVQKRKRDVPYLRWRLENAMGCPPACACVMSTKEKEMRVSFHWRQGSTEPAVAYRKAVAEWFVKFESMDLDDASQALAKLRFD